MGTLFPRVLKKTPLLTSTVELRFSSSLPGAALFGLFYSAERDRYSNVEQLGFANIPDEVRQANPAFTFQPQYKLSSPAGGPAIQIGPRSFSLVGEVNAPHIDVPFIEGELARLLRVLDGLGAITEYERLGLRYVNFFEGKNVLKRLTLGMSLEDLDLTDTNNFHLRVEIPQKPFTAALVLMSEAQIAVGAPPSLVPPPGAKRGSLIDIDVFADALGIEGGDRPKHLTEMFVSAHDVAKRLFFKTLSNELIQELEPQET
jgi:uncharacterized protein (TIGR04255 family)